MDVKKLPATASISNIPSASHHSASFVSARSGFAMIFIAHSSSSASGSFGTAIGKAHGQADFSDIGPWPGAALAGDSRLGAPGSSTIASIPSTLIVILASRLKRQPTRRFARRLSPRESPKRAAKSSASLSCRSPHHRLPRPAHLSPYSRRTRLVVGDHA